MKFFLPDWDDQVDPKFDFKTETTSLNRNVRKDKYAHEIFKPERIYDGVLVSRMALGEKGRKREAVEKWGLRKYLRLEAEYELMGDCGAFGYIREESPPFTTAEIIDYYIKMKVDLAVSIDHIIVSEFADQNEHRYQITIKNARDFLEQSTKRNVPFTPIGAVQGWDVKSYVNAAETLVDAGYGYIAIGGLARSTNSVVTEICEEVSKAIPDTKIHVFGVSRANLVAQFTNLGITSGDSASPLRQAWLASKDNYYTADRTYAAIRIPIIKEQRATTSIVKESKASYTDLQKAEKKAMSAIRKYANKNIGLKKALVDIKHFNSLLGERKNKDPHLLERYEETLKDRPWEKCSCKICSVIGVEVVIFRGNNRNRRRGFHNLWTLRRRIAALVPHFDDERYAAQASMSVRI